VDLAGLVRQEALWPATTHLGRGVPVHRSTGETLQRLNRTGRLYRGLRDMRIESKYGPVFIDISRHTN